MKAHQKIIHQVHDAGRWLAFCAECRSSPRRSNRRRVLRRAAQQDQQSGTTVDPSKGPLQPVPTQNQPSAERPA